MDQFIIQWYRLRRDLTGGLRLFPKGINMQKDLEQEEGKKEQATSLSDSCDVYWQR